MKNVFNSEIAGFIYIYIYNLLHLYIFSLQYFKICFIIDLTERISIIMSLNQFYLDCKKSKPSLEFLPKTNSFVLHYPGPDDFGQQDFFFDPQDFISAFYASAYKHSTPKSEYSDFNSIFFNIYPNANQRVRWAFSFLQINPTVIRKTYHLNRSIHRRVFLQFRQARLQKALNCYSKPASSPVEDFVPDIKEIARCQANMSLAVSKAAVSYDMSFLDIYLENYKLVRSLNRLSPHLSPRQYQKVLESFIKAVDDLQK